MHQLSDKEPQEPLHGIPSWEALRQRAYDLLRKSFAYGWEQADWEDMTQDAIFKVITALRVACEDEIVIEALRVACEDEAVIEALRVACEDETTIQAMDRSRPALPAAVLLTVVRTVPMEQFLQALPAVVLLTVIRTVIKAGADETVTMGRFSAWFTIVVRNVARDRWAWRQVRHGRDGERTADTGTEIDAVEDTRMMAELTQWADTHDLYSALKILPNEQERPLRQVVRLTYWLGHSSREIGTIYGVSPNTVRGWLKQAITILRKHFEKE